MKYRIEVDLNKYTDILKFLIKEGFIDSSGIGFYEYDDNDEFQKFLHKEIQHILDNDMYTLHRAQDRLYSFFVYLKGGDDDEL